MPKMQVYLPADLYERVKARGEAFNVSAALQRALEESLAELERRESLDRAVRAYEARHGRITTKEMVSRQAADRSAARRPTRRGKPKKHAA